MKLYFHTIMYFVLFCGGCAPVISSFDQYAYTQCTSLKVDALHLMDEATDSVQLHSQQINQVMMNLEKIYEYDKNRPNDSISTRQWHLLIDPNGHSFGKLIKKWEHDKILNRYNIEDLMPIIGFDFDQIAQLESKKLKPSQISNP